MKIALSLLLVALSSIAQSSLERSGFVLGSKPREKTAAEINSEKFKAQAEARRDRAADLQNTNNYRVVNGQLYNTALATTWSDLPGHGRRMSVTTVMTNGLVCAVEREIRVWNSAIRFSEHAGWQYHRTIFVKNHPDQATAADGEYLGQVPAMQVGRETIGGATLDTYDCGLPPTPKLRSSVTNNAGATLR